MLTDIQKHMMSTFVGLRVGVGVVGILMPWFLVVVGLIHAQVPFADSMSAYYHATPACYAPDQQLPVPGNLHDPRNAGNPCFAPPVGAGPVRNWFVGLLFFIGTSIFAIRGFSIWEDWLLNIACVGAIGVALNPMPWPVGTGPVSIHYVCAMTFFGCSGLTCIFCADKTLKEIPPCADRERVIARYKRVYWLLGVGMFALPGAAFFFSRGTSHATFILEVAGVSAFGAYWLVKTAELRRSEVERRIMQGTVQLNPRTLR